MSSEKYINITKYIKRLWSVPQKIDHFEIFKKLIGTLYELNFIRLAVNLVPRAFEKPWKRS